MVASLLNNATTHPNAMAGRVLCFCDLTARWLVLFCFSFQPIQKGVLIFSGRANGFLIRPSCQSINLG